MSKSGRATILHIDDQKSIRFLMGGIFNDDYNLVTCDNAIDALKWLTLGNIPALIVLDLEIPELNGIEFVNQMKNSGFFRSIPILVLSGNDDAKTIQSLKKAGVEGYLTKPFIPKEIRQSVKELINRPKADVAAQSVPFELVKLKL